MKIPDKSSIDNGGIVLYPHDGIHTLQCVQQSKSRGDILVNMYGYILKCKYVSNNVGKKEVTIGGERCRMPWSMQTLSQSQQNYYLLR